MSLIVYVTFLLLKLLLFCHQTDAVFMWTAPPPAWNQTVSGVANIRTAVIRVIKGSTYFPVRWNYTLLDGQSIRFTQFSIRYGASLPDDIGDVIGQLSTIYNTNDYRTRFSLVSTSEFYTLTINRVTDRENATFQCRIQVGGNTWAYNVRIEVTVPPKIAFISADKTVNKGDVVALDCTADGYPAPNITWTRLSDNSVVTFPLTNTGKQDEGAYRCTADNGFGNPASKDVFITVHTTPVISAPKKVKWRVMTGDSASIECQADGEPSPQYVWTNAAGEVITTDRHLTFHKVNDSTGGRYICTATNSLGADKRTISVQVTRYKIYGTVTVYAEYKSGMENTDSETAREFGVPFKKEFDQVNRNTAGYNGSEFIRYSNGSVVVYFALHFKFPVTINEGILNLWNAVHGGTIGPYRVRSLKTIKEVAPITTPSASTTTSSAAPVSPGERVNTDTPDGPPWVIIGATLGGALLLAVILGVVAWWVRKDVKRGNQTFSRDNEIVQNNLEADTDAQKSKNPGEVLYADLGDLNPRQKSKKSKHPDPLPLIKRPDPYVKTEYAEITHFINRGTTELQEVWPRNGDRSGNKELTMYI